MCSREEAARGFLLGEGCVQPPAFLHGSSRFGSRSTAQVPGSPCLQRMLLLLLLSSPGRNQAQLQAICWGASSLGGQHRLEKQICGLEKQKALKLEELRGKAERSHPVPGMCPKSQHQPQAGALCVGVASGGRAAAASPTGQSWAVHGIIMSLEGSYRTPFATPISTAAALPCRSRTATELAATVIHQFWCIIMSKADLWFYRLKMSKIVMALRQQYGWLEVLGFLRDWGSDV